MIAAIVQARMASTRLPGKVMKPVLGKPLIDFLIERLSRSKRLEKIVVATSVDSSNDPLCRYLENKGIPFFRGSEDDVLDRYYQAAKRAGAHTIVRVTADCPVIDYKVVDEAVDSFAGRGLDYLSNGAHPPLYPNGMDVEVFSFAALERAWSEAKERSDREHVTPYIKKNAGVFRCGDLHPPFDYSGERWTVDREEDLQVVRFILESLYREDAYFDMQDILELKKKSPAGFEANRSLVRNEGYLASVRRERAAKTVVFRADGSHAVGMGHLTRCAALAEAFRSAGARPLFLAGGGSPEALRWLAGRGLDAEPIDSGLTIEEDGARTKAFAEKHAAALVVIDLNHARFLADRARFAGYARAVQNSRAVLFIDGAERDSLAEQVEVCADWVAAPYRGAEKRKRFLGKGGVLMAGSRYFILRRAFRAAAETPRQTPETVRRYLISMGGSDPGKLTLPALSALAEPVRAGASARVIIGPAFSDELKKRTAEAVFALGPRCVAVENAAMERELAEADEAILSGGLTKYEALCLGTPSVILSINANEDAINAEFDAAGLVLHVGSDRSSSAAAVAGAAGRLAKNKALRRRMSEEGRREVDGNGTARIAEQVMQGVLA